MKSKSHAMNQKEELRELHSKKEGGDQLTKKEMIIRETCSQRNFVF